MSHITTSTIQKCRIISLFERCKQPEKEEEDKNKLDDKVAKKLVTMMILAENLLEFLPNEKFE